MNYRTIFSRKRTIISIVVLLTVSILNTIPDFCSCRYPKKLDKALKYIDYYYIFVKALLISTCLAMLFYVYKVISVFFSEPFWNPVVQIFTKCFGCQCRSRSSGQQSQNNAAEEGNAAGDYSDEVSPVPGTVNPGTAASIPMHAQSKTTKLQDNSIYPQNRKMSNKRSPSLRVEGEIELAPMGEPSEAVPDHLRKCSFQDENHTGQGSSQSNNQSEHAAGKGGKKGPTNARFQQLLAASTAQTRDMFRRRRRRRMRSRHQITATMFFSCVVFLIVTLPSSLYEVIVLVLPESWVPDNLSMDIYLLTSTFYGLLFILNPFLFTCSDRRIRKTLIRILYCTKLRKKYNEVVTSCKQNRNNEKNQSNDKKEDENNDKNGNDGDDNNDTKNHNNIKTSAVDGPKNPGKAVRNNPIININEEEKDDEEDLDLEEEEEGEEEEEDNEAQSKDLQHRNTREFSHA